MSVTSKTNFKIKRAAIVSSQTDNKAILSKMPELTREPEYQ